MPESYTGTEGTEAAAAGMDVLDGTEDRRQGWLAINKARDYIAQKFTAAKAYTDTKVGAISLAWENITGKPNTFPSTWGTVSGKPDLVSLGYFNERLAYGASQPIYSAGGPVTSSYVAMYRNGDGRVGISPSARRFKKDITAHPYTLEQLAAIRVVSYRLKASLYGEGWQDAPVEVGVIAEELLDAGLGEFVAFQDGEPISVHYERLALVAISALQDLATEVDLLAQRIAALEAR